MQTHDVPKLNTTFKIFRICLIFRVDQSGLNKFSGEIPVDFYNKLRNIQLFEIIPSFINIYEYTCHSIK